MTTGIFQKAGKLRDCYYSFLSSDMSGSRTEVGAPQQLVKVEWMNPLNLSWVLDCIECILPQECFFLFLHQECWVPSQISGTPLDHLTSFPIRHLSFSETVLWCSAYSFLISCPGSRYFHVCEAVRIPQLVTVPGKHSVSLNEPMSW